MACFMRVGCSHQSHPLTSAATLLPVTVCVPPSLSSYLLQIFGLASLWAPVPLYSLEYFQDKFDVFATSREMNVPENTKLAALMTKWHPFATSADVLSQAEDGILFYFMASLFRNLDDCLDQKGMRTARSCTNKQTHKQPNKQASVAAIWRWECYCTLPLWAIFVVGSTL